ncbi:MAG: FeoA family protein [Rheinheimera sp.]|nr:FeoA family protein [Rheinheimera sp.]
MTAHTTAIHTPARHTLWDAPKKASVSVVELLVGLNPLVVNRLREMGLEPGQQLLCLGRGPFNGPLVVQIQDCVYTLERQVAQHILIQPQL